MAKSRVHAALDSAPDGQRLDVWLFRARLFKTRSLATKMILKGKIRVTQHGRTERVSKASTILRPGDRALFMRGDTVVHIEMLGVAERRGPFKEAQTLYKQLPLDVST